MNQRAHVIHYICTYLKKKEKKKRKAVHSVVTRTLTRRSNYTKVKFEKKSRSQNGAEGTGRQPHIGSKRLFC